MIARTSSRARVVSRPSAVVTIGRFTFCARVCVRVKLSGKPRPYSGLGTPGKSCTCDRVYLWVCWGLPGGSVGRISGFGPRSGSLGLLRDDLSSEETGFGRPEVWGLTRGEKALATFFWEPSANLDGVFTKVFTETLEDP